MTIPPGRGRCAATATCAEFLWRAMPDLEFQDLRAISLWGEPTVAFYWRGTGTFTGPLGPAGFAPTGARVAFEGFHSWSSETTRVPLAVVYDVMDVSRQVGIVPKPGEPVERPGRLPSG